MATAGLARQRSNSSFWRVSDWRLFPKLMVAFVLVIVFSLSISGYDSITSSRDALFAQGTLNIKASSSRTSDAIDSFLVAQRHAISVASALPDTITLVSRTSDSTARANAQKTLKKVATEFDYESIVVINPEGTITLDTAEQETNTNVKYSPAFTEAMRGIVGYVSDPSVSVTTNKPVIYFSAPIFDPAANILGIVRGRASLDRIWSIVEKDWGGAGPGTFGFLLDTYGIRLAHSSSAVSRDAVSKSLLFSAVAPISGETAMQLVSEKRFGNAATANAPVQALPEVAAALASPESKTFESSADLSPVRHYASLSKLTVKPWSYVVMAPLSVFTKAADDLTLHYFLILVIVAGLTSIGVFFVSRRITQPIAYLTQAADRISLGELDTRIDMDRKDEIGELAESIIRLQSSIKAAMERFRARRSG